MKIENLEWLHRFEENIDCRVELKFSLITDMFYISSKIKEKRGGFEKGVCIHENTPDEAIESFKNYIKDKVFEINDRSIMFD